MATNDTSVFANAYTSFSGVDMKAMVRDKVLTTLQAVSTSITREKAPIFTLGSADPRSHSRGKRGIVGTLVMVVFDRHMLLDETYGLGATNVPYLDKEELRPGWVGTEASLVLDFGEYAGVPVQESEMPISQVGEDQQWASASYSDQLTPFDIVITAANEYGKKAKMGIGGVEILNEGTGISVDDIITEQQMSYVARAVVPWTAVSTSVSPA
jgi:hypothetical protein